MIGHFPKKESRVKQAADNPHLNSSPGRNAGRFYYGWVLVIAFTLVMAAAYGANFTFSVFLKPISEWFGWERATTSSPLAISLWISGILAVGMGLMTDRLGPRTRGTIQYVQKLSQPF